LHGADAEDAEVEKGLSRNHGKPDDEQERVQQRAQALAIKLAQTYEELTRLLERNPGVKRQENRNDSPQRTPMAQRENGPSALNARQSGMRWVEVGYPGRG
jgi:hypothetical protein